MRLAPGLVWCKSCMTRTALSAAGGKCPVCDPDQGDVVSKNADAELERIDAVLAGSDSRWEGAEWRADGSHEDEDRPDWVESFMQRHIVPNPSRRQPMQGGSVQVLSELGWVNIGAIDQEIMFGFDGSHDDDAPITFGRIQMPQLSIVIQVVDSFTPAILDILFGWEWFDPYVLDRWEDDGGPIMATDYL